ncbi:MarR family winged helix-turn-helix transcriptional regulator [uncultured Ilyobacter sp.]|jgi:DNA-binding MarR family transcriptional regulator|uniref:MarR family winged helix-turn-helix transcriptional regulator n=1 Tax=uncultured Ilyobacter sp. TaxID=544433 RepID=UPI0029BFADFF|nr:MarR family winged helix-turn-helix transcriptional regulator [uncultured Ilyobacter sp.]
MKSYGEYNDLNLKLIIVLERCYQTITKKDRHSMQEDTNLTVPQFSVLEILYHKGDLKVGDIIEKTLSSIGNINVVVNNLERQGLVKKEKCSLDKRVTYVKITSDGRKIMDRVFPKHVDNISKITEMLSEDEKKILIELLKKWGKS